MNWKGKLIALVLWGTAIGALGTGIYVAINEQVENRIFTAQFITDIKQVTRGKMIVLDIRIHKDAGILETFYMNRENNTAGTGLTDPEAKDVQKTIDDAIEWAMINRGITVYKWAWAREDRQGELFMYIQAACDARHLLEKNPSPNCSFSDRWMPLPARNQRYR